jgi:hypothetical protein
VSTRNERSRRPLAPGDKNKGRARDATELREPAWERQPWETALSYQRFRLYRDLSATRSVARVAREAGVSESHANDTAKRNLWTERCRRYDAFLDTRHLAVTEQAVRDAAAENARRVGDMQQTEWEIWEAAKETVLDLLRTARGRAETVHTDDGERTIWVDADPRAAGQAAQLLREADRVARMATGQPTEGMRPKPDEAGRESDLDAFLKELEGDAGAVPPGNTSSR